MEDTNAHNSGTIIPRVRDRSGYEVGQHGCRSADVAATGGSKPSSGASAHGGRVNKSGKPGATAPDRMCRQVLVM